LIGSVSFLISNKKNIEVSESPIFLPVIDLMLRPFYVSWLVSGMTTLKFFLSLLILVFAFSLTVFICFLSFPRTWLFDFAHALAVNAFPLGLCSAVVQLQRETVVRWELEIGHLKKQVLRYLERFGVDFKKRRKIYRMLGVTAFVSFLKIVGWESIMRIAAPVRHDQAALKRYRDEMAISEFAHGLSALLIGLGCLAGVLYADGFSWKKLIWLLVFCYLVHILPILTQWRNRERLDAMVSRRTQSIISD
jgi:hypothetical protein